MSKPATLGLALGLAGLLCLTAPAETIRAARSVHLRYAAPPGDLFYNEVTVEQSTAGSYFMACGWNTGYFGMQELGVPTNKVVIFSVWDPTQGDDANKVPVELRVEVLHEGQGTRIKRFGGEGTGGQCKWNYAWQTNETCRFMVRSTTERDKTSYAGWFYDNHAQKWRHLVTFRTRTGGKPMAGYYSFVEDFRRDVTSVGDLRRARFGNGWVRDNEGSWVELNRAKFTASHAPWESVENIDAGTAATKFFLATGGNLTNVDLLGMNLTLPEHPKPAPPEVPDDVR